MQTSERKKTCEPGKCKLKCFEKATEEGRQAAFYEYCELGTNKRRWDFHINYKTNSAEQRCCTDNQESRRSMTR